MIDQDVPVERVVVHDRDPGETDIHYERRLEDPLEIALATTNDRLKLCALAEEGYEKSLQFGRGLDAIEFAVDYAYRSFGIVPLRQTRIRAHDGRELISARLEAGVTNPAKRLFLEMRQFDLASIEVLAAYTAARRNGSDKEAHKADQVYDAFQAQVIRRGANLLKEYQREHQLTRSEGSRQDLRGTMFELLYATYMRNQIYQEDSYDPAIVLSASEFEDRSAKHFSPLGHNYDLLVMNGSGQIVDIVQCKSGKDNTRYSPPIRKVNGKSFIRFVEDPEPYIAAINLIVNNEPHISEQEFKRSQQLLEGLFEEGVHARRFTGKIAVHSV